MELSFGISNIFKVLRVDLVKRLTYLNNPEVPGLGNANGFDCAGSTCGRVLSSRRNYVIFQKVQDVSLQEERSITFVAQYRCEIIYISISSSD